MAETDFVSICQSYVRSSVSVHSCAFLDVVSSDVRRVTIAPLKRDQGRHSNKEEGL